MAGIGFEIGKLRRQESISAVLAAGAHGAVIAAGPWLFTIFSLATITILTEALVGRAVLATFRALIIYAFAISLVMTAPVAIVVTRLVADALWLKQSERVGGLLHAAYLISLALVGLSLVPIIVHFAPPPEIALALAASSLIVTLIWIALSFCGAVRDYMAVTLSFLVGLLIALVAAIGAAVLGYRAPGMVIGFVLGLAVTFFAMHRRVVATFPQAVDQPVADIASILKGLVTYWPLAVGALAGTAGVWIDKWVFWASSQGETVEGGLLHAPLYDSSMFIASLAMIPSLSAFVTKLETTFFERYQRYYASISSHGTYAQIEADRQRLSAFTLDSLALVAVVQAGISAVLVLAAPLIVEALDLQFRQIAILRYGALGVVFQFIFIASTSMLLFFDRRRLFLGLQLAFLALNGGLAAYSIRLGEDFHGAGYFMACLVASLVAYVFADVTFKKLNFLTFIGNNQTISDNVSRGPRSRIMRALDRLAERRAKPGRG